MGWLDRLLGREPKAVEQATPPPRQRAEPRVTLEVSFGTSSLVQLSGTTTFAKDAIQRLTQRHALPESGYLVVVGVLQREPENAAEPNAVTVNVEGERIGYLPGYLADGFDLSVGGAVTVPVQIFTALPPKGFRAEAWAWLGDGTPDWAWSESNRPPMTPQEKVRAHQAGTDEMVAEALAGGGRRAEAFRAGMVDGIHYLQAVEPIKQLKRDGRLDEALALCFIAIEGAEGAAKLDGLLPAPWYTEQAAIILRKLGRRDDEIVVLRRYLDSVPSAQRTEQGTIAERLRKLES